MNNLRLGMGIGETGLFIDSVLSYWWMVRLWLMAQIFTNYTARREDIAYEQTKRGSRTL